MTTKDYVYLGLIVLAALVFYFHGFYAGLSKTRKLAAKLFSTHDSFTEMPPPEEELPYAQPDRLRLRGVNRALTHSTIRASFGRN